MLPDTGADFSVIGPQHLEFLNISRDSLKPLSPDSPMTLTADGSPMKPALGTFQATLTLGKRSCSAVIQVQDGFSMPLLCYSHCLALAIIPPDFPKPISEAECVNRHKELDVIKSAYLQPSLQQEPLLNDDSPTRPFESVSADFFSVSGKAFLIVTDQLSGWPVVVPCNGDTTASVIRIFCRYFREVAVPRCLRTDGGPQFTSKDFQDFLKRWGVHHVISSSYNPQSNSHAKAATKSIKQLILKTVPSGNIDCEEFDQGLLELRNTPNATGRSPAQILYGHPLRTCVPAHPQSFSKEWQVKSEDCDRRAAARAEQVKLHNDQLAHPLPRLCIGQTVRIQGQISHCWDKVGVVMSLGRSRDYEVRLPSGQVSWHKRRFLCPVPKVMTPSPIFLWPLARTWKSP